MKANKTIILTVFFSTLFLGCDLNECSILKLADLLVPKVVEHFDNNGSLIHKSSNELYYNERTGEYFNNDYPPNFGLIIGDYIQMATNIYNEVSGSECELGAAAPVSTTAPELKISSPNFNGVFPTPSMYTPPIPKNSKALTATRFQLITPGNYSVNFNANAPRNIKEHSYDNNFYFGNNGNYAKSNLKPISFTVLNNTKNDKIIYSKEELKEKQFYEAPKNIDEMKNLTIYKFMKSKEYKKWIVKNKQ